MSQSLSVIMPVRNAESKLASIANRLLEVTSELTREVELVIVDDGSTDNTIEVAMDLKRLFPQISVIRNAESRGYNDAVQAGVVATRGEMVLVHKIDTPIRSEWIRDVWHRRTEAAMMFNRSESAHLSNAVPVMHSKATWNGGTQMSRRDAMTQAHSAHVSEALKPRTKAKPAAGSSVRVVSGGGSALPAIFHQHPHVEMQPVR